MNPKNKNKIRNSRNTKLWRSETLKHLVEANKAVGLLPDIDVKDKTEVILAIGNAISIINRQTLDQLLKNIN